MKLIDLDYDAGHVTLPADNDDWFDHFEVEVEDNEYEYFLEKLKWWEENESREYHDKHVDADDEYFLLHYCPEIHKKIKAKLEEIAIEKWGEAIKKDLFNFDILIGYQPYKDIYGEEYLDSNAY